MRPKKVAPQRREPVLLDFQGNPYVQTLLPLSVSATLPPTAQTQTPPTPDEGTTAHPSRGDGVRAAVNGQVVSQVWHELSEHTDEAGLAGLRFVQCMVRGFDELELLQAISEHAVEGHHAAAITAEKMGWRIGRMHEVRREEQKREERSGNPLERPERGLRPIGSVLEETLKRLGLA